MNIADIIVFLWIYFGIIFPLTLSIIFALWGKVFAAGVCLTITILFVSFTLGMCLYERIKDGDY